MEQQRLNCHNLASPRTWVLARISAHIVKAQNILAVVHTLTRIVALHTADIAVEVEFLGNNTIVMGRVDNTLLATILVQTMTTASFQVHHCPQLHHCHQTLNEVFSSHLHLVQTLAMASDELDTMTGMHMGDVHDDVDVEQHVDVPIVYFDLK